MNTDVFNAELPRREGLMRRGVGAGVLRNKPPGLRRVRESDKPIEGAGVLRLRVSRDHDQSWDRRLPNETEAIHRTICRSLCATGCHFSESRDSWRSLRTQRPEQQYDVGRFHIPLAFPIVKILLDTERCDPFGEDGDQPLR